MKSPAFGIAYLLWIRLRWVLIAMLILVPFAAVTVRLVPASAPYCQFACLILFFSALLPLFNACTLGPADLGARASGYPSHMFVLPLSNRSLVAWPMLFGAIIFGGLWMLVACLVFIPTDLPLPIIWPAMMLVGISVWLQAIAWSPFPSPFIRVPALVIGVAPLILVPILTRLGMPPANGMVPVLLVWCFTWSLAAFLFAIWGLARARSGRQGDWYQAAIKYVAGVLGRRVTVAHSARQPFRSAAAAQFWHEFRRNAITMPAMVAIVGVPVLAVLCQSLILGRDRAGFAVGSITVTPAYMTLAFWLVLPLLLTVVSGPGLAKFDVWGKEEMPQFFAIRPMTSVEFIRVKATAILVSTLVSWAAVVGMFVMWAVLDASPLNAHESLVRKALHQATPWTIAAKCAVLFGLAAVMYRNVLVGMCTSLIGRKWISMSIGFICAALLGLAAMAGVWIFKHPEAQSRIKDFIPWIIACLLAEKVFGAVAVGFGLRRWYGITAKNLAILYATWMVATGSVLLLLTCLISPTWVIAAGVALFVPFARIAVMPLALEFNRHR